MQWPSVADTDAKDRIARKTVVSSQTSSLLKSSIYAHNAVGIFHMASMSK